MENKSKFPKYVTVQSDGNRNLEIYCPVCGRQITHTEVRCPHLLFDCEYSNSDEPVIFNYLHPKLHTKKDVLAGELSVSRPRVMASELNMNPDSTLILRVTQLFDDIAGGGQADVVFGIDFRPGS